MGYHPICHIATLTPSTLFVKKGLTPALSLNWCSENKFGVSHVYQGLISKSMQHNKEKFRKMNENYDCKL